MSQRSTERRDSPQFDRHTFIHRLLLAIAAVVAKSGLCRLWVSDRLSGTGRLRNPKRAYEGRERRSGAKIRTETKAEHPACDASRQPTNRPCNRRAHACGNEAQVARVSSVAAERDFLANATTDEMKSYFEKKYPGGAR
jgi:hypothetical protein